MGAMYLGRMAWSRVVLPVPAMAVALAMMLGLGLPSAVAEAGPDRLAGQPAPDFALKDTRGTNLRLSEYRGQVVVLSFWADWCGRCLPQLEALAELQRRHGDRGLQVLAVNIDPADDAARDAAGRLGIPVLRDRDQAVARGYDLDKLPVTLLLDQTGRVRRVHGNWRDGDAATLEAGLADLLDPPLPEFPGRP
jgi:peroxiredoxin